MYIHIYTLCNMFYNTYIFKKGIMHITIFMYIYNSIYI